MYIKDFKLNFYDCKNNHKIENILINKFKETQKMLISNKSKAENYICKKHNLKYFKQNSNQDFINIELLSK